VLYELINAIVNIAPKVTRCYGEFIVNKKVEGGCIDENFRENVTAQCKNLIVNVKKKVTLKKGG
jgi:hypothetical protein